MGIVPNKAAATFPNQAKVDTVDLDILAVGSARTGVVSGCAVTAQGSPDMTVAVSAGLIIVNGLIATVAAGNVTITAADATNPRFDLITVNNSGTKARTGGTAAANPEFPAIPANSTVLAAVYVPANDTAINANQIVDKRVTVSAHGATLGTKTSDTTVVNTTTETILHAFTVPVGLVAANDILRFYLFGTALNNSGAGATWAWRWKFGAAASFAADGFTYAQSANSRKWYSLVEMQIVSTTAQKLSVMHYMSNFTTNPVGDRERHLGGFKEETQDTSAAARDFEFRVVHGTAAATIETVAKGGYAQVLKATG